MMNQQRWTVLIVALVGLVSLQSSCDAPALGVRCELGCSMVNLLATPERYDGKLVRTIGYATIEFERQLASALLENREPRDQGRRLQQAEVRRAR